MLLEVYGRASHVGEVAELAAEVLGVALTILRLPPNSDKGAG